MERDRLVKPASGAPAWGIGIILVSILSVRGGLAAMGLGNVKGSLGQIAALTGMGTQTTTEEAFFGGMIALASAIRIAGGVGVLRGRHWGLIVTAALSAASLLLDLGHLARWTGRLGLGLNGAILYYCCSRLGSS